MSRQNRTALRERLGDNKICTPWVSPLQVSLSPRHLNLTKGINSYTMGTVPQESVDKRSSLTLQLKVICWTGLKLGLLAGLFLLTVKYQVVLSMKIHVYNL